MAVQLAELAVRYGCELHGDPDQEISCVGTLESAGPGAISFLANPLYQKYLAGTKASAVILREDALGDCKVNGLVAADPYAVYAAIAAELYPLPRPRAGVHASAVIGEDVVLPESCEVSAGAVIGDRVELGERVVIGPNSVIGDDVVIGDDSRLYANVSIYQEVRIGQRCIVHASAVIGSDGFGIAPTPQGWQKVPQVGGVCIGNDVEIGASTTIDRGAIDDTVIGNGVKLDNLIQIGHNVRIGDHTVMASQAGVSGSTTIGAHCVIGGASAFAGHLKITDNVHLTGRSNVTKSIASPGAYSSILTVEDIGTWRKLAARFKRLDVMARKLRSIEQQLKSEKEGEV